MHMLSDYILVILSFWLTFSIIFRIWLTFSIISLNDSCVRDCVIIYLHIFCKTYLTNWSRKKKSSPRLSAKHHFQTKKPPPVNRYTFQPRGGFFLGYTRIPFCTISSHDIIANRNNNIIFYFVFTVSHTNGENLYDLFDEKYKYS